MTGRSKRASVSRVVRRRRPAQEIRARLLDAAREEFRHKSYTGATTAAIARRAEVAEIQMFRYFPTKADLFREAVFSPLLEHFRTFNNEHGGKATDKESIRDHARLYIAELQSFLNEHAKALISLFMTQNYTDVPLDSGNRGVEDLQAYFSESVAAMTQRANLSTDVDPEKIVRVAFGTLLGCLTYREWLFPDADEERTEIEETISEFILHGVGPYSDLGGTD